MHGLGPVSGSIPPFLGTGASADLDTGSGPVELTLFNDRAHVPGTAVVEVFGTMPNRGGVDSAYPRIDP